MDAINEDYFFATYYIESGQPLSKVAETIADIESTGQWLGTGTPTDLYRRCRAEVGEIREAAPGKGEIDILFPTINLNLAEAAFPSLWLTMIGGGTHALVAYEKSRLMDFKLPPAVLKYFPGPAFGPEGTRKLLGASPDELLLGTIIKPTAGLTPAEVADICYQAAAGGLRFIKDDEKMLNTAYCPLKERVQAVNEALKRAEDETGKYVIYAPHITTSPEHLLDNAHIALENGARGLMINFFAAGFNSLETLRRQVSPSVPIYAHCGGKEAFGRAPGQGVDPVAVARFVRLLGGDYFRVSTVGGYLVGGQPAEVKALARGDERAPGRPPADVAGRIGRPEPAHAPRQPGSLRHQRFHARRHRGDHSPDGHPRRDHGHASGRRCMAEPACRWPTMRGTMPSCRRCWRSDAAHRARPGHDHDQGGRLRS